MKGQLSFLGSLCPPPSPEPDYLFGLCACGWLLAGWHASAFDQPGWARVRRLWLLVPEDAA